MNGWLVEERWMAGCKEIDEWGDGLLGVWMVGWKGMDG